MASVNPNPVLESRAVPDLPVPVLDVVAADGTVPVAAAHAERFTYRGAYAFDDAPLRGDQTVNQQTFSSPPSRALAGSSSSSSSSSSSTEWKRAGSPPPPVGLNVSSSSSSEEDRFNSMAHLIDAKETGSRRDRRDRRMLVESKSAQQRGKEIVANSSSSRTQRRPPHVLRSVTSTSACPLESANSHFRDQWIGGSEAREQITAAIRAVEEAAEEEMERGQRYTPRMALPPGRLPRTTQVDNSDVQPNSRIVGRANADADAGAAAAAQALLLQRKRALEKNVRAMRAERDALLQEESSATSAATTRTKPPPPLPITPARMLRSALPPSTAVRQQSQPRQPSAAQLVFQTPEDETVLLARGGLAAQLVEAQLELERAASAANQVKWIRARVEQNLEKRNAVQRRKTVAKWNELGGLRRSVAAMDASELSKRCVRIHSRVAETFFDALVHSRVLFARSLTPPPPFPSLSFACSPFCSQTRRGVRSKAAHTYRSDGCVRSLTCTVRRTWWAHDWRGTSYWMMSFAPSLSSVCVCAHTQTHRHTLTHSHTHSLIHTPLSLSFPSPSTECGCVETLPRPCALHRRRTCSRARCRCYITSKHWRGESPRRCL